MYSLHCCKEEVAWQRRKQCHPNAVRVPLAASVVVCFCYFLFRYTVHLVSLDTVRGRVPMNCIRRRRHNPHLIRDTNVVDQQQQRMNPFFSLVIKRNGWNTTAIMLGIWPLGSLQGRGIPVVHRGLNEDCAALARWGTEHRSR